MTIKYEELEELTNALAPIIAALSLRAVTAAIDRDHVFTGGQFSDGFDVEAERIYEGYKAALAGDMDQVEAPESSGLDALLAALSTDADGGDPLDLSL